MQNLVLDLETIPDSEMPTYVPREGGDSFPPPPFWQIAVIGLLYADSDLRTIKIGHIDAGPEKVMLESTVKFIGIDKMNIITFNGRKFDLPVLTARCMRHGIQFPARFERETIFRYSDAGHMDVADALTDYGAGRYTSLDAWSKLIGMPGKLGTKGSEVEAMIADGKLEEVQVYCMCDVVQTHAVRLRLDLSRGRISRDKYLEAMKSLIDAVDGNTRLVVLAAAMNRKRLMLEDEVAT